MNWLDRLNKFPPYLVRICSTKTNGRAWRNTRDIARDSGLSIGRVAEISFLTRWDDLPAKTVVAFCRGCAVNLDDYVGRGRFTHFLSRSRMAHVQNLKGRRKELFARLLALAKRQ